MSSPSAHVSNTQVEEGSHLIYEEGYEDSNAEGETDTYQLNVDTNFGYRNRDLVV